MPLRGDEVRVGDTFPSSVKNEEASAKRLTIKCKYFENTMYHGNVSPTPENYDESWNELKETSGAKAGLVKRLDSIVDMFCNLQ